jgi:hypothetical protein
MSDTQKLTASATVTVNAKGYDVWAVWADVNAWKAWDDGIADIRLNGNFKEGNSFTLTPQGGEPVEVTLKTVTQGEEFSDETLLPPFGVLRGSHRIEQVGEDLVQVTHELVAEIKAHHLGVFVKAIWPDMQAGLASAVNNIADIVSAD